MSINTPPTPPPELYVTHTEASGASVTPQESTQSRYPLQAMLRTATALVGALAAAPVVLFALAEALSIFNQELASFISDDIATNIAAVAAVMVAVATALTRIMAIPAVNAWLERIGLGALPKGAQDALDGYTRKKDERPSDGPSVTREGGVG